MAQYEADEFSRGLLVDLNTQQVIGASEKPDLTRAMDMGEDEFSDGIMMGVLEELVNPSPGLEGIEQQEAYLDATFEVGTAVDLGLNPKTINRLNPEIQEIYWNQVELARALFDATRASILQIHEIRNRSRRKTRRPLKFVPRTTDQSSC